MVQILNQNPLWWSTSTRCILTAAVHPSILSTGLIMADGRIKGSNARCVATAKAIRVSGTSPRNEDFMRLSIIIYSCRCLFTKSWIMIPSYVAVLFDCTGFRQRLHDPRVQAPLQGSPYCPDSSNLFPCVVQANQPPNGQHHQLHQKGVRL